MKTPLALAKAATAVEKDLHTTPGLGSIASSASLIRSEIAVRPDFARAADLGVTSAAISIYIVLALLFKAFLHPFTIPAALPLSLGGAFVGLLLADKSFSMPSLIGLIMLMGIATKNSIPLVEYAIVARRGHGLNRTEALLDACHKRARPIIMTTLAMGAGMLPIAFGWGAADPSFRSPMAVAVIGGLMTSTVLSLLVIPSVFSFVDDVEQGIRRAVGWLRRKPAVAAAAADAR